jgi:AcrR family transcriptional regulator
MKTQPTTDKAATRGRFSRDEVARAALALLDEHGLDSLSMRRLADHLGVGTMTLYVYFRNKEELLDAVVDAAVADREQVELDGTWQEQLRQMMQASRRGLGRHPSLARLRADRPVLRPEALRFAEAVIGILRGAGFSPRDAAQGFRLLFTYLFGYVSFSPESGAEDARRQARVATAALPRDEFPAVSESADELADAMAGQEAFDFGLDRIVDGLEARLRALG